MTTSATRRTRRSREKTAALTDYDRLGDLSRLQKLVAEADKLWPAEPSKVAAMKAWVDQAADLEKRLAGHREVRDRLRTSAGLLPYTDADREADLRAHAADQEQLAKLRADREKTAAALAAESRTASRPPESRRAAASARPRSRPSLADLRTAVAKLDAEIQRLDAQIHERLTWKFESSAEQFKHDTTAKLVADLTAFVDPDPKKGLLADVRGRLAFAESVEQRDDRQVRDEVGGRDPVDRRQGRVPEVRRPQDQAAARADPDREGPGLGPLGVRAPPDDRARDRPDPEARTRTASSS